ncbi:membrane cofactor protein-like isoform X6 [Pseudopipra pipra]|uniref:membrane cofactor protein-like isoform X6 n=1 Tax=Pseudopipra pipra TaxID=415032 RepID=UPI003139512F
MAGAAMALRAGRGRACAPAPRCVSGAVKERSGRCRGPAAVMGPLLLPVLVLWGLGGARAEDACGIPGRLQYAELEEKFRGIESFPVGSQVSFTCRPGYMKIPGKSLTLTCGPDLQWSPKEQFCTERRCKHPGELANGVVDVTDLTFGSTATFSCREGYRLFGNQQVTCVIRNEGVDWDREMPFCEVIPCDPPPSITNGHHTEAANYVYQTAVSYSCDAVPAGSDPFSLIGSDTIFCTSDEHSNGVWSGPPPQCRVVKCENPRVKNGYKISGFGPSYTYKDSVQFVCDPGYYMVGEDIISCAEDNTWSPPIPTCEKNVCGAPEVTNGAVVPLKSVYNEGESVQIKCNAHCSFPDGTKEVTVTCQGQKTWSYFPKCRCGYVIACICVLVVIVVLLAAFWAYKKFFSQNGKRDSTPCTAEYKMCKA